MIRITGGQFRGRNINCPRGKDIRPSTAFLRESLFNILGKRIINTRFLDLFAGCGIVGFEAISRGTCFVEAVEKSPLHCRVLEKNRDILKLDSATYYVSCTDAFKWVSKRSLSDKPFDIIFLDPPYSAINISKLIDNCINQNLLSSQGILIWEKDIKNSDAPTRCNLIETRVYGTSALSFYTHSGIY